ncbi:MAG TPA: hypothetical protein ENK04_08490 [Gammaproteobacteria bacterium]|nr:hypothetical protein [Gammaproteobacteria bacterium]
MNEPINHDHPDALLPWYANGTLTDEERMQVAAHLERCEQCREELRFLTGLRQAVKQQVADAPASPELGLKRLMREIDADDAETPTSRPATRRMAWWQPSLAAAAVVIVIQGVLLLNLWQGDDDAGMRLAGETRPAAVVVQIQFDAAAREEEIRALLRSLDARFVDGPSAVGLYRIELSGITPGDNGALARVLSALREQQAIVRHVAAE